MYHVNVVVLILTRGSHRGGLGVGSWISNEKAEADSLIFVRAAILVNSLELGI